MAKNRREIEKHARKQISPIREGVQARKCHVARADHERHKIDRKSGENGRRIPEDHGCAVHGKDLVVGLRRQKRHIGVGQLQAHQQRLEAANDQEDKGSDEITNAQFFVIDGGEPAIDRLGCFPKTGKSALDGGCRGHHCSKANKSDKRRAARSALVALVPHNKLMM